MTTHMENLPDIDGPWDYDDPAGSEASFAAVLPQARAAGDSGYLAELLTQIARAQGLQRRFDEAHLTMDEAAELLDRSPIRARVRYLLERGRLFNSSGQAEQARPLFLQARDLALEAGEDNYTVDAIHMLAIVDPPAQGLDWNLQAITLAERSEDPRTQRWLASLYYNSGWSLHDQGRFEEAIGMFEMASRRWAEEDRAEDVRVARWCVARALRSLGRYSAALERQRELMREYEDLGKPSGYVFEELAENLLALERPEEAKPFFARAYAELSQDPWLQANEPERLSRLIQLEDASA